MAQELAATSRLVLAIANPSRIMRTLQLSPCMWYHGPVHTEGNQCQAAEIPEIFFASDRDDILVLDRLGFWLIA